MNAMDAVINFPDCSRAVRSHSDQCVPQPPSPAGMRACGPSPLPRRRSSGPGRTDTDHGGSRWPSLCCEPLRGRARRAETVSAIPRPPSIGAGGSSRLNPKQTPQDEEQSPAKNRKPESCRPHPLRKLKASEGTQPPPHSPHPLPSRPSCQIYCSSSSV